MIQLQDNGLSLGEAYGRLPLGFRINRGKADDRTQLSTSSQEPTSPIRPRLFRSFSIGPLKSQIFNTKIVDPNRVPRMVGTITNTATITSNQYDPNTGDNTATKQVTVLASADLEISQTDVPDPAYVGQNLTYTITAWNNGPSPATAVFITDNLPNSVTFRSAVSSLGICTRVGQVVTCNIGDLGVGQIVIVTIVVTPNSEGAISNAATITGNEHDPNTGNNTFTKLTTVWASAELAVNLTGLPNPVRVGQQITYTLTAINNGHSPATGVIIVNTLSDSVTYESATSSKGSCACTGQLVTCSVGDLGLGETVTMIIAVTANIVGGITNTATITGNDPNLNINTSITTTATSASGGRGISRTDNVQVIGW